MKKKLFVVGCAFMATLICAPVALSADKASASPSASVSPSAKTDAAPNKIRPLPFHGMVSAVDQTAKTFTISGKDKSHVFKITEKTVMTKAGKSVTMVEIVENVEVKGSYWAHPDGALEAKTVNIGPMALKKTADKPKKDKPSSEATASASPSASAKASPGKP
jgi:hypothetical protein